MSVSASTLRSDLYRLLDRVLETGEPLVIERKGRRLRIVAEAAGSRLDRLPRRPGAVTGDPGDLAHLDWSQEWRP
jgi:antitoxin (DNA-binding transcriptional repressor) of toxin-antitoxin stability system